MDIGGIGGLAGVGQAGADRKSIADDFDTFLQLLTTQLKHQNPLDPLNTHEFTDQLVKFSTVEQNVKTNQNLEALLRLTSASVATAAVGYIGKAVMADGVQAELKDGAARWSYTVDKDAPDSTIMVRNRAGDIVYSQNAALAAGTHTLTWDGADANGDPLPDGVYSIQIIAKDNEGQAVSVQTSVGGVIDRVDLSAADPILYAGDKKIPLSTVRFIGEA